MALYLITYICPKLATRVYAHGTHRQAGTHARNHKFNQNKPIKSIKTEILITCAQDRAHVLSERSTKLGVD